MRVTTQTKQNASQKKKKLYAATEPPACGLARPAHVSIEFLCYGHACGLACLGLVWMLSYSLQSMCVGIEVKFSSSFTPIHLNTCGLMWIWQHPNKTLVMLQSMREMVFLFCFFFFKKKCDNVVYGACPSFSFFSETKLADFIHSGLLYHFSRDLAPLHSLRWDL
jgi:hypothetical protein